MSGVQGLREALKAFTQEVCEALSQVEVPGRLWTRIIREEGGRVSFPQEERREFTGPPLGLLVALHTDPPDTLQRVISSVQGDSDLAAALLVDGGGNPITDEKSQAWWATNQMAGAFLRAYFAHTMKPVFDEKAFDTAFNQLMTEVHSQVAGVTELSPLMNAQMECDRIEIDPGVTIRKLTIDELEEWLNESMEYPFMMMHGVSQVDPSSLDCAIEVTYEKGRYEAWGTRRDILEKVSDLVTALRLLTDKNVHIAFTKRRSDSILQPGRGTSSSIRTRLRGANAELTPSLQPELVAMWKRIQAVPTDSTVRLALRRWDIVSERFSDEDALIDYWIALESLFAPDSFQEVRYRVSLRIAAFVGVSADEREQIYNDLRDSYDLRSRIVHGGVPNAQQKAQLVGKTRSYLRTALMKLLLSDEGFDPRAMELQLLRR